jgi:hypothetical protein
MKSTGISNKAKALRLFFTAIMDYECKTNSAFSALIINLFSPVCRSQRLWKRL